jgi:pyruvate/2-oxoacid:ferredoxin oxidoreductase beta subunit
MAPVVEVKMFPKEEQILVHRVCPGCGQGFIGRYVERLCPKCRHKFLENDEMRQLQNAIIRDYYLG